MSILIDRDTRLLVQGITGREGGFHAQQMLDYGTNVVAGVTPGKGGQTALGGAVPVFDTCAAAVDATGADCSVIFVPAVAAPDAVPGIARRRHRDHLLHHRAHPGPGDAQGRGRGEGAGARLIGPNCPGATTPEQAKVGIIPGSIHRPGRVGLVSRSGTLTYEVVQAMTDARIGQSTCVGIGGDPISGSSFIDILELFAADPETEGVVLIGEIGGGAEEAAAAWKAEHMPDVPMVAFIAGRTAPPGRRMGHAGAIISGSGGTAEAKISALEAAGIRVAESPTHIPRMLIEAGIQPD